MKMYDFDTYCNYGRIHVCFEDNAIITKYNSNINSVLDFLKDTLWYVEKIDIIPQNNEAIIYCSMLPEEENS